MKERKDRIECPKRKKNEKKRAKIQSWIDLNPLPHQDADYRPLYSNANYYCQYQILHVLPMDVSVRRTKLLKMTKRCSSRTMMMMMYWNEDGYVCSSSMDRRRVENRFDIAMVCSPCEFEDESSIHICDCRSKSERWNRASSSSLEFTLPQNKQRCAFRCFPSGSIDVNSKACVPSSTLILYEEISLDESGKDGTVVGRTDGSFSLISSDLISGQDDDVACGGGREGGGDV